MLGAIFGDIVGSIYERHNVKSTDFQLLTRYSHPTDDSIMTLAVAQALMETWDIWSDTSVLSSDRDLAVLKALTANMQSMGRMYPDAGYGGAFRRWIRLDDPQQRSPGNSFLRLYGAIRDEQNRNTAGMF